MEIYCFVLCCVLFTTVATFTIPDSILEYSKNDSLLQTAEIQDQSAPRNLRAGLVTNVSVSLEWDKPQTSTGRILRYRVRSRTSTTDEEYDTNGNRTSFTVFNLKPHQNYTFRVQALTAAGPGKWSTQLRVRTSIGIPHRPFQLRITSTSNTTVGLTWLEPLPYTGPVLKYRVHWDGDFIHGEQETDNSSTSIVMQKLEPYVNYTFKVLAITEAGPGEWSDNVTVMTEIGVPRLPRRFLDRGVSNTSVRLMWLEPWPSTGPILKYRVLWTNSTSNWEQDTNDNSTYFTVEGLTPYTKYVFEVLGITAAGPGETSDILKITTDIGVPHAPVSLRATRVSNTTVDFDWEKPEISTGPILQYRMHWKNSSNEGELDFKTSSTSFTVDKLIPGVLYTFKVLGITKAGPGEWSESVEIKTLILDPCISNPCLNGGTCKVNGTAFQCDCSSPYYGKFCEKEECNCENGSCEEVKGKMTCTCPPEWAIYKPNYCKKCECGQGFNCTFEQNWFEPTKFCSCGQGYIDINGVCESLSF